MLSCPPTHLSPVKETISRCTDSFVPRLLFCLRFVLCIKLDPISWLAELMPMSEEMIPSNSDASP